MMETPTDNEVLLHAEIARLTKALGKNWEMATDYLNRIKDGAERNMELHAKLLLVEDNKLGADTEKLADEIAAYIFEIGSQAKNKVQRISFMTGDYPNGERALGGLCETALSETILHVLNRKSS